MTRPEMQYRILLGSDPGEPEPDHSLEGIDGNILDPAHTLEAYAQLQKIVIKVVAEIMELLDELPDPGTVITPGRIYALEFNASQYRLRHIAEGSSPQRSSRTATISSMRSAWPSSNPGRSPKPKTFLRLFTEKI